MPPFHKCGETYITKAAQTMGSGYSIGYRLPKCPADFDKTDFSAILKLYDTLDTNGDFEVESNEVAHIANIHVQNKIATCQNAIDKTLVKQTLMAEDMSKQ